VAKRLDRFLLSEEVLDSFDLVRQWVAYGGESDHFPIMLELRDRSRRVSSPFKFFEGWISDPSYQELVRGLWSSITDGNQVPAAVQFVGNLKRLKQATMSWAREKKLKDDQDLRDIETTLSEIQGGEGQGFTSLDAKELLCGLEKRRRVLLEEKEALWRLKSRAIWLSCGDENTKFFQAFSKGRKMANTIWGLRNRAGEVVSSFEGLAKLGTEHFSELFKVQEGSSIAEIVQVARLFPRFVEEEENGSLNGNSN
jgi:hypothetical protein